MNPITQEISLSNGQVITLETGKLARQADGAVVLRSGNCMLLATVVASKEAKEDVDFLPLSVDYQEKFAANGKIPGSFLKREARLSDYEILISRLIDRALRPIFPDNFHADVQVVVSLLSADADIMPDALAGLAASAAIMVSDIPFNGPIAEVRVARIAGEYVVNPGISALVNADIDIIVAGTADNVVMVEGESKECSEADLAKAIYVGHDAIKQLCDAQNQLAAQVGRKVREYNHERENENLKAKIEAFCYDKVYEVALSKLPKQGRSEGFKAVLSACIETLDESEREDKFLIKKYFHDIEKRAMRAMILDKKQRLDGRKLDEVRPIWCEVNYLPSAHGSALFTRGETQSLTTVTLGSTSDEQLIDGAMFGGVNRFLLHYNFPGFSTGEVRPNRGPGRREVGHGNLAMRSLKQMLPENNPYVIRIVSDILESNGSSSMATVCAGSLALMDAGVQLAKPVSGIAMGLIAEEGRFAVLSDILGDEDHLGDMDFKVTGTQDGICGCQMDIKIDGLPYEVLIAALEQSKAGRLHILSVMNQTLDAANEDLKPHSPRIVKIQVDREFIGAIIGPGGKIIQEMQRSTGATVNIEEVGNFGIVEVFSANKASLDAAVKMINAIIAKPEIGAVYEGKVKTIQPFGAFVEFMPGKDGLLHISEISWERLATMDGIYNEGDTVTVKLLEVDPKTGKFRLSAKALLPRPEGMPERTERPDRGDRPDRNERGGGNRSGGNRNNERDRRHN